MISRDYGWLMVGKYIRNHQLREEGGEAGRGGEGEGFHSHQRICIDPQQMNED